MAEEKWPMFLIDYPFEGSTYSVEICARNWEDAQNRFQALPWGRVVGKVAGRVEANVKSTAAVNADPIFRALAWLTTKYLSFRHG